LGCVMMSSWCFWKYDGARIRKCVFVLQERYSYDRHPVGENTRCICDWIWQSLVKSNSFLGGLLCWE
jgi:hypothetical protein